MVRGKRFRKGFNNNNNYNYNYKNNYNNNNYNNNSNVCLCIFICSSLGKPNGSYLHTVFPFFVHPRSGPDSLRDWPEQDRANTAEVGFIFALLTHYSPAFVGRAPFLNA